MGAHNTQAAIADGVIDARSSGNSEYCLTKVEPKPGWRIAVAADNRAAT